MGFESFWQGLITVGIITLIWVSVLTVFMISFAIGGEHMRRQRTEDPDDDWYK